MTDPFHLDRLATAHEREAAWCDMQARALQTRADGHRQAATALRQQLLEQAS